MVEHSSDPIKSLPNRISSPVLEDVDLSVIWIGHASVLIQIHDKVVLTDPVFTNTVGMVSERVVEPGIDPSSLSHVDFVLISHTHFDHLSYGSLSKLPKEGRLLIPFGGAEYTPEFGFLETREMKPWDTLAENGLTITAVPSKHFGGRYGFDIPWMAGRGYTGYVIQYKGKTIYFAGDTGYQEGLFAEIGKRFSIDVALVPIAPLEPREMMSRVHLDPADALRAFGDLHAKLMIPIHYGTFYQGLEPRLTVAQEQLDQLIREKSIGQSVHPLAIGERAIVTDSLLTTLVK